MANILVYALHYDGAINKNSLGAVSEGAKLAAELGGEAHAILLGENVPQELAASLGKYGAKKVLVAEGPEGLAQPLVDAMAAAIAEGGYSYALFGGGLLGFEIGAGLAARLGRGRGDGGHDRARRGRRADRRAPDPRRLGDLRDQIPLRRRHHHRPPERVRDQATPAAATRRWSS